MTLQNQVLLPGHLTVPELCALARRAGARQAEARQRHHPDVWELRILSPSGEEQVWDAFLNSFAAEDFVEILPGPSTLLWTPTKPDAATLAGNLASLAGGLFCGNEAITLKPPGFNSEPKRMLT